MQLNLWDGNFAAVPGGPVPCDGTFHQRTFSAASTGLQLQYQPLGTGTAGTPYMLTVTVP